MMEDIAGDYKDKTVTLEDFPYFSNNIKMASIHPCKHASVMKTLLDRANSALKIRREKQRQGKLALDATDAGLEGLVDNFNKASLEDKKALVAGMNAGGNGNDEWEVLKEGDLPDPDDEVAIRVDQYLVVFLKVSRYARVLDISLTESSSWRASLLVSSTILPWESKCKLGRGRLCSWDRKRCDEIERKSIWLWNLGWGRYGWLGHSEPLRRASMEFATRIIDPVKRVELLS